MVWTYFRLTLCSQVFLQTFIIYLSEIVKDIIIIPVTEFSFACIEKDFSKFQWLFFLNPKGWEIIWSCIIEYVIRTGDTMLHLKHHHARRLPSWIDCPRVHSLHFPLPAPPPTSRLPWAGDILPCRLAVNFSILRPFHTQTVGATWNAERLDGILRTYIESYFLNNLA